jgi:hypothetical protein
MAAIYSSAVLKIGDIVDAFLLKRELPMSRYVPMLEHAFDCFRQHVAFTSRLYYRKTITTDVNGTITMPDDMVDFIGLALSADTSLWYFTENGSLNVDAVTAVKDIDDENESLGYGGRGGINDYYYKIDWAGRKIYTDGAEAQSVVLFYISTGIRTDSETLVDISLASVIDSYMYMRLAELDEKSINEIERRRQAYEREVSIANRYKLPPLKQVRDAILKLTTQGIVR